MTQKYSFFDAVEGLPKYTAQDVADRTAALAGKQNGYLVGNQEGLTVAVAGTNVTLQTGAALIQGRLYVNDEDITFSVPLCSTGKIRRDRVVIKLDTAVESRNIVAYIKQGVEGVSGISPPSLTQAGTIYELSVARLEVTDTAIIVVDERGTDTCPELYTGEAAAQVSLGHSARTDNPHGVTKAQVGLGNADNTADADKPLSAAVTNALANYLLKSNIINDLITGGTDKALSAEQGKVIKALVDGLGIASGSNANGYYLIFPDNTAICWGKKSKDLTFSPAGNVCYSGFDWISFPITFSSIPNVNVSVQFGNIGSIQLGTIENYRFYSSVLSANSTPRPTTVHYSAFGEV